MSILQMLGLFKPSRLKEIVREENGWYPDKAFAHVLKRERLRSDRSGSPVSYVVFDLSLSSNTLSSRLFQRIWDEFILFVQQNTRGYDIKHITNSQKIGLLLPDTSLNDAKLFIERISEKLHYHFEEANLPEATTAIRSVKISSYPVDQLSGNKNEIEARPVLIKNVTFDECLEENCLEKTTLNERVNVFMDWQVTPTPYGTLAITAPSFWDITDQYWRYISYTYIKRSIDILGSLFWIIMFALPMAVIALVIKLTSKGPVFYLQKRTGYLGKPFPLLKFRTMYADNDSKIHEEYVKKLINGQTDEINNGDDDDPMFKITNDPRITPVGHFLREMSLDEIPQLFNVLRGDMSLVGPRPPIDYEVEAYKNWHHRRLFEVKPGITGLWQVSGRNKTTFDGMVRLDIQYAESWSLGLDIEILLRTVGAVFGKEGR